VAVQRFGRWKANWQAHAPKAVACLEKDLDCLLAFFMQPKARWKKTCAPLAYPHHCDRASVSGGLPVLWRVRRRTDPMTCFTHERSADRILYAIFNHANQRWAQSPLKEFTQNY